MPNEISTPTKQTRHLLARLRLIQIILSGITDISVLAFPSSTRAYSAECFGAAYRGPVLILYISIQKQGPIFFPTLLVPFYDLSNDYHKPQDRRMSSLS